MDEAEELKKFLIEECGYLFVKEVPSKGICAISQMFFTFGIMIHCDHTGHGGRYCYHTLAEAIVALANWDGNNDPPGNWIVHKGRKGGDRQNPNYKKQE